MAIKSFNPYSPSRRFITVSTFEEITTDKPYRPLVEKLQKHAGRNNTGKMTVRHKGGGVKRLYRVIDFKRTKDGIPARVATIEYDPNRNARIALVNYVDGEKRYIIAPLDLKVGDMIESGPEADIKIGKGGQMARSAGSSAQLMAKEGEYALLRLPSGEIRKVHINCRATVGQVGNIDFENITIGKAGRNRWLGIRPANRGVVMNPNDHPHGGGEGHSPVGRKRPVTPWGKCAFGTRTRKQKKASSKLIVKRRTK